MSRLPTRRSFLGSFAGLLASSGAAARALAEPSSGVDAAIHALAADVQRWGGSLAVHLVDVASGQVIAAVDEHRPMNPASNAKLVTAAAALRVLGPGHRFLTGLYGQIDGEAVDELVLRGDGDPSLRGADLVAMAGELHAQGVRRVKAIVLDQSFFDAEFTPPAFEQQPYEWAAFRAPVAAVSVNENTVTLSVLPSTEGHDARVEVEPPGFVELNGSVSTSPSGQPEHAGVSLEARGQRLLGRLTGSVPQAGKVVKLVRRVEDPRLLAGFALRAALKEHAIPAGAVKAGGSGDRPLLVSHRSASLGELLIGLGKDSDNFYAEMIFRAIGARSKGRPTSSSGAADAVRQALDEMGVTDAGVVIKNGSGLFDANRLTAAVTTSLLRTAYREPAYGPEFVAQLSIGGVDGTLHHRFRDWEATRAIRAKTGTLDAVAALSGYVLAPNGRSPAAFSVYVNGISGKVAAARAAMDRVVEALAASVWRSG